MHCNLQMRGRCLLPPEAVSSGAFYLSTMPETHAPDAPPSAAGARGARAWGRGRELGESVDAGGGGRGGGEGGLGADGQRRSFKLQWGPVWSVPLLGLGLLGLVVGLGFFILFGPYGKTNYDLAAFLTNSAVSCQVTSR
jgi:hypothetical protein